VHGPERSKGEHDAVGVSMRERSQRGDEVVQALKAVWDDDPVEYHGQFYQIPRSFVGPKPVDTRYIVTPKRLPRF
jgi:alkanesulfonate monooxygenase SsuD/methylene tetrahydromethanopterin reductase-like flavin-dependent oxidoreductase (luciferase family)